MSPKLALAIAFGVLACASAAPEVKTKPFDAYGIPESVLPMMLCSACERAGRSLGSKLQKLILDNAEWSKPVKKDVWSHMKELCLDKELFPTGGDELYLKSCAILMRDYHKQLLGAFRRRLTPESELFHQDLLIKPFCREIGACAPGVKSMDEALSGNGQEDSNGDL